MRAWLKQQTKHRQRLMTVIEDTEHPYPRPLSGAKVEHLPSALVPARTALIGRYVTLEPLDAARHAGDLFEASHGSEASLRIWDYLPWGPWKSEAEYTNVLRQQTARQDQVYYAVRPAAGGKACGQTSFLDIQPDQGVIIKKACLPARFPACCWSHGVVNLILPRGLLTQDVLVLCFRLPRTPRQVVPDSKRGLTSMRRLEQITRMPRSVKRLQCHVATDESGTGWH